VQQRSTHRTFRPWALTAACCLSLAVAAGCDKKPDPAAPGTPAATAAPGHAGVGVLDSNRMITALGWATEQTKQKQAVVADVERELRSFRDALNKAVEDERKKINTDAKLSTENADKLNRGVDLDKLPITREQREEYITVVTKANSGNQQATEYASNAIRQWDGAVGQMYTEAAKPAVRRAAQTTGVQVVLLAGAVFHYEPGVDITDKVIDELQKAPPQRNFPPTPVMNYPAVTLNELNKATTQPVIPPPSSTATRPAAR
jgi:Skp family chaperone for outer membrane proteins